MVHSTGQGAHLFLEVQRAQRGVALGGSAIVFLHFFPRGRDMKHGSRQGAILRFFWGGTFCGEKITTAHTSE